MEIAQNEKTTVLSVARAAGVAVGTVSRVLNTPDEVGDDLRLRVRKAIDRFGYRPLRRRGGRKSRARRATGNLGIVFLGLPPLAQIPVLSEAVRGVESEVAVCNENLMMANLPSASEVPAFLRNGMVDGLIVRCALAGDLRRLTHPDLMAAIESLPHVWLAGKPSGAGGDVVECDLDGVGRLAAEHLAERGHRAAVTIDPQPSRQEVLSPLETFALHARSLGMQVRSLTAHEGAGDRWPVGPLSSPERVIPLAERWLAMPAGDRPRVIVLGTDATAIPLYTMLQQSGIAIGREASVISLRMEPQFASGLVPGLCTVDNKAETIGRLAVRQLRWRFRHPEDRVASRIRVAPALLDGASIATVG